MMYLWASYEKKMWKKIRWRKESDLEFDPNPEPNPDPLVRGTDPGIRIQIHIKKSPIPNAAWN